MDLAGRGARLVLGCRNVEKGIRAAEQIMTETGNRDLVVRKLDLSCMQTVRQFAREFYETEQRYVGRE